MLEVMGWAEGLEGVDVVLAGVVDMVLTGIAAVLEAVVEFPEALSKLPSRLAAMVSKERQQWRGGEVVGGWEL